MDELLKAVVTGAPSFLGLVFLAYVLMKQNERLLSAVLDYSQKCSEFENKITALEREVRSMSRGNTLTDDESGRSHQASSRSVNV